MKIFYSHSKYKYGTEVEAAELRVIERCVNSDAFKKINPEDTETVILNPATDIEQDYPNLNPVDRESIIMGTCIHEVMTSDAVVFSTINGVVGRGCWKEITTAFSNNIPLFVINNNRLERVKDLRYKRVIKETKTTREYAVVYLRTEDQ